MEQVQNSWLKLKKKKSRSPQTERDKRLALGISCTVEAGKEREVKDLHCKLCDISKSDLCYVWYVSALLMVRSECCMEIIARGCGSGSIQHSLYPTETTPECNNFHAA